jgi:hypothetical protein
MSSAIASMFAEALQQGLASESLLEFGKAIIPTYQTPAHVTALAEHLEAVKRGEIKRLMVFMPPRHGKSMTASELFPADYLGTFPDRSVIAASHTQEMADDFGRKVRNVLRSEEFAGIYPDGVLRADSTSVRRFHTISGGGYFAAGLGGPITGRGADLFLIDDPVKSRSDAESPQRRHQIWEWYTSTAYTRLSPNGAIVLIQTRWHPDDLAGRILAHDEPGSWTVLEMPAVDSSGGALWPERFNLTHLDKIRASIGQREWDALYQQRPTSSEGGAFKASAIDPWIGTVPWVGAIERGDAAFGDARIVTGVDLATRKGEQHDLTVLSTVMLCGHRWRLLHMVSGRIEAATILKAMLDIQRRFHNAAGSACFRVEDNAAQAYIVQMAQDAQMLKALGATPEDLQNIVVTGATTTAKKRDAELGIPSIASDIEMGRWDFPEHREVRALREEMLGWSPDAHTGDRLMSLWIARGGLRVVADPTVDYV